MARKNRNLASFDDVANTNKNINVKINNNKNEENVEKDFISELINQKGYEEKYVMSGIYIEKDLAAVLDNLAKKGGRGTKSRIVNESLRQAFSKANLI